MMRKQDDCPYLNDVRARRAADLDAHLQHCPLCQKEQRALERLAMALRRGDADVSISKQQHEQQKSALVERAQRSLAPAPKLTETSRPPAPPKPRFEWLTA